MATRHGCGWKVSSSHTVIALGAMPTASRVRSCCPKATTSCCICRVSFWTAPNEAATTSASPDSRRNSQTRRMPSGPRSVITNTAARTSRCSQAKPIGVSRKSATASGRSDLPRRASQCSKVLRGTPASWAAALWLQPRPRAVSKSSSFAADSARSHRGTALPWLSTGSQYTGASVGMAWAPGWYVGKTSPRTKPCAWRIRTFSTV